jgi:hypothetical protein
MPKGPDLIAERTFFVSGKGNGGPAVVFRLWRPNLRRTIPGVDMS